MSETFLLSDSLLVAPVYPMSSALFRRLLLVAAILCVPAGVEAAAPKTILKLPFVIKKPGAYQLASNLTYNGVANAIQVEADDVTIDLRGYFISFGGDDPIQQESAGIYALDRKDITVRNGTIRGFYRGIQIKAANQTFNLGGHTIENVRADRCLVEAFHVEGRFSVLRNNSITTVRRFASGTVNTYGIFASGAGVVVQSNRMVDIHVTGGNGANVGYGIYVDASDSSRVTGNTVANTSASANLNTLGIILVNCPQSIVADNHVSRHAGGLRFTTSDASIYRDNTVNGAIQAYSNDGSATAGTGNLSAQ